jgi:glycosyltransferase involved in cell wall biosynthesis
MKIVYIVTRADPIGGVQIHVRDLATAMLSQGHSPVVLVGGGGSFVEDLRSRDIPVVVLRYLCVPIHPLRDLLALREIRDLLKQLRPDLINVHSAKAGILGRLAGRSLDIPVLLTAHGWTFTPGIPAFQAAVYRQLERFAAPLATKIITVSEYDRRLALDADIAGEDRLVAVHNGIPDVPPHLRAQPGRTPARLVMVARFGAQKDHPTLLRALAGVKDQEWALDLIGDGPLMARTRSLARTLGLENQVRFLGQRMDVEEILAQSQVSFLISNWEGFPLSVLEAMRAGLPVVATSVAGVGEAVQDEETGYLVSPGDVELLQERIRRLLADPALRARLGSNGRRRYERHFTLGQAVNRTLAVYRDVLGDRMDGPAGSRTDLTA